MAKDSSSRMQNIIASTYFERLQTQRKNERNLRAVRLTQRDVSTVLEMVALHYVQLTHRID